MIYPYGKMYEPYVRHQELISDQICKLVSPRGWGLEGEKVSYSGGELAVKTDFIHNLSACTAVWFVEDTIHELPEKVLWEKLETAIENDKKILFTRRRKQEQYEKAYRMIPPDLDLSSKYKKKINEIEMPDRCITINTPVLVICGLDENTDKFEIQMAARKKFMEKGYLVSSITSRNDSEIYGMHSLPQFLFDSTLSETDKIIRYNHYVKSVELSEEPELIIIGIPGGLIPFDNVNHNNFGILAYEITNAVSSDIAIMCMLYDTDLDKNYSLLKHDMKYKFDLDIRYCHVAANVIDTQTLFDYGKRGFLSIDPQIVEKKIKALNKNNVMNMKDDKVMEAVVDHIINILSK